MELDAIQPAASHKTPLAAQNNLNINWELLMIAADASRVSEFHVANSRSISDASYLHFLYESK